MRQQDAKRAQLSKQIKTHYQAAQKHARSYVEHVLKCAEYIEQALDSIAHGNTKQDAKAGKKRFLEEDCGIPYSTAMDYLNIWKNKDKWWNESLNLGDLTLTAIKVKIKYVEWREQCLTADAYEKAVAGKKFFEREMRADKEIIDAHRRLADRDTALTEWWNIFHDICLMPDEAGREDVIKTIRRNCDEFLNAPDDLED